MPENQSEKKGKLIPVIRGKNCEASPHCIDFWKCRPILSVLVPPWADTFFKRIN